MPRAESENVTFLQFAGQFSGQSTSHTMIMQEKQTHKVIVHVALFSNNIFFIIISFLGPQTEGKDHKKIRDISSAGVLFPLPVQNQVSKHMLSDICYRKTHAIKSESTLPAILVVKRWSGCSQTSISKHFWQLFVWPWKRVVFPLRLWLARLNPACSNNNKKR